MKLRIFLADDHALFSDALRMTLNLEPDMEVVAQVQDGADVVAAALLVKPDVVCMDINLPGLSGVEATQALLARMPHVKVIGLSAHSDAHKVAEMATAGALGYVAKAHAGEEVAQAIRSVHANRPYFSPPMILPTLEK
jgi:two-component system NarL family response regulator